MKYKVTPVGNIANPVMVEADHAKVENGVLIFNTQHEIIAIFAAGGWLRVTSQ